MPQNPLAATVAKQGTTQKSMNMDVNTGQVEVTEGGLSSNLTLSGTAAVLVKATAGRVNTLIVKTVPTGTGGVYDINNAGSVAAANEIRPITTADVAGTILDFHAFPCFSGIAINPGGGTIAVAYS